MADDLLDEERVALGLRGTAPARRPSDGVPPARRRTSSASPRPRAGRRRRAGAPALAPQPGQRGVEARRSALHRRGRRRGSRRACRAATRARWRSSSSVGRSAQCRSSSTSSTGTRGGDVAEQPDHRLEQPVALGLGVAGVGRRAARAARRRSSGIRRASSAPYSRAHQPQLLAGPVSDVVAERLEERLVGDQRLLGRAAGEHDRPRRRGTRLASLGEQPASCRRPASPASSSSRARGLAACARLPPAPQLGQLGLRARPVAGRARRRSSAGSSISAAVGGGRPRWRAPRPRVAAAARGRRAPRARAASRARRAAACAAARTRAAPRRRCPGPSSACHQQHVARLAVGLGLDQAARGPLDRGQLRAAERCRPARPITSSAWSRMSASSRRRGSSQSAWTPGEQPAAGDVERHLGQRPGRRGRRRRSSAGRARRTSLARRLDVDPDGLGQLEARARRGPEHDVAPERRAQPRQQRAQRGVLGRGARSRATARRSAPRGRPAASRLSTR